MPSAWREFLPLAAGRLAMTVATRSTLMSFVLAGSAFFSGQALAQMPPAVAAPGETVVATFHAEGAQVYECKAGNDGKLAWTFREPIATLFLDGKTVGR